MSDNNFNYSDENHIISERRQKLASIRENDTAYPNDFRINRFIHSIVAQYNDGNHDDPNLFKNEQGELIDSVSIAGRIISNRVQGKISFLTIQDEQSQIQIFVSMNLIGADVYADFKTWDIGDIIGVSGGIMRSNTGELTIRATSVRMLTKTIRPLPFKQGLSDIETRYRQRYMDLAVNPDTRNCFRTRSRIISSIREFLNGYDFLEVETPMMHPIPGGASAAPFTTHHNALNTDMYLRIAPELYLKRLLVGGFDRVYELNRNFRNEGVSVRHNPEFTMVEIYQAYANYVDMMDLTEGVFHHISRTIGVNRVHWNEHDIELSEPFHRIPMIDAVIQYNSWIDASQIRDLATIRSYAERLNVSYRETDDWGRILLAIFEETVETNLIHPTFITHYPLSVSPLARSFNDDHEITERFELFIGGREIANGFSELNDPEDQEARFRSQVEARNGGDDEAMHFDADYIQALEYGMPPAGGLGIGIDRLVMIFTESESIRDVLLFPHMRRR